MIDTSILDQHEKVALSFSGGKDSEAVAYLLRDRLDRITLYHCDTGDLLPEQLEIVEHVKGFAPNFVTIQTNVLDWISQRGLPTDLLPHTAHWVGREMGEATTPLVGRYECCWMNLMEPTYRRIVDDGNTLLIRGTKAVDMKRLPRTSGDTDNGVTIWYPLLDWTNDQVFTYLRSQGAPISRVYDHTTNSPECARCTAWWSERRASYLRQHHPELYQDYACRMRAVIAEIEPVVGNLLPEMVELQEGVADG